MSEVTYSGFRTGFPFLVPEAGDVAVGAGTPYPVGLTLPQAMLCYWQVKSWKVVFTGIKFQYGADYSEVKNGHEVIVGTSIAREIELVTGTNVSAFGGYVDGMAQGTIEAGSIGVPLHDFSAGLTISLPSKPAYYKEADGKYYFSLVLDVHVEPWWPYVASVVDGSGLGGGKINFLGEEYPAKVQHGIVAPTIPSTPTITITPHKYWTYGGIYDEDSGARI